MFDLSYTNREHGHRMPTNRLETRVFCWYVCNMPIGLFSRAPASYNLQWLVSLGVS